MKSKGEKGEKLRRKEEEAVRKGRKEVRICSDEAKGEERREKEREGRRGKREERGV